MNCIYCNNILEIPSRCSPDLYEGFQYCTHCKNSPAFKFTNGEVIKISFLTEYPNMIVDFIIDYSISQTYMFVTPMLNKYSSGPRKTIIIDNSPINVSPDNIEHKIKTILMFN